MTWPGMRSTMSGSARHIGGGVMSVVGAYGLSELYQSTVEKAQEIKDLATEARKRARPGKTAGARARQYISLERLAVEIRMVYNEIPGLLQTAEYAREALSASPLVAASNVTGLADERAERGRSIIKPDGPRVWIALGEDGLDRSSGGADVLLRQLEHLREIARMPNVSFRVVPKSAGNVAGLSAPFTLLHTQDGKSFAFVATAVRGDYVKAADPFTAIFQNAWERAVPEVESAAILGVRITDLTNS